MEWIADEEYLSPRETSNFLNISFQTLANWRMKSYTKVEGFEAPPYYKKSPHHVMYKKSDLVEWVKSRRIDSSKEK